MTQSLQEWAENKVATLLKQLQTKAPVNTGNLKKSIQASVKVYGMNLSIVINMAPYWQYVDEGRKPGKMPPVSAILKWLDNAKLSNKLKLNIKRSFNLKNQLAWAIATSIKQKGIKPNPFFSSTYTKWKQDFSKEFISSFAEKQTIDIIKEVFPDKKIKITI